MVVLLVLIGSAFNAPAEIPASAAIAIQADNIANEYKYAIGLSAADGHDDLFAMSGYFRENVLGFDSIYALIVTDPSGPYRLTVGNFLRGVIDVNVSATQSSPQTISLRLADKERANWDFSGTGAVRLTINYTLQNVVRSKTLDFTTYSNQTIGWSDIGISSDDDRIRRDGVRTVTRQ